MRVEQVTRARFRHVIADELAARPEPNDKGRAAFLKGFGFISPAADLSAEAAVRLEASALVGLYVPAQRAIYVRPHTRSSSAIDPDDVLHELGHALQDDVFGMSGMLAPLGQDERLAHKAVYEGDATVIAWGVAGQRAGRTAEAAIADHRTMALAQSATLGMAQELEAIPGWSGVPRVTQVELFFPYSAGADSSRRRSSRADRRSSTVCSRTCRRAPNRCFTRRSTSVARSPSRCARRTPRPGTSS